jgi:two-component system, NtrC family, response regulator
LLFNESCVSAFNAPYALWCDLVLAASVSGGHCFQTRVAMRRVTTTQVALNRLSPPPSNEPIALAPSMIEAVSRAHAFAPAKTPIVLYGESGTGKTFFAEYIHQLSGRSGTFHAFSVGTVAPQLALDELFGHIKGAFTDARENRMGHFASAAGGTLLLDDCHTLDPGIQKQLLQVLDRGTYSPVGCDRILALSCRIIFAMSDEPAALMRQGLLLKDLRYRFGECTIGIPALRERRAEIPGLAQRALHKCERRTGLTGPSGFTDCALALLCEGQYEGNVRQLEGAVLSGYLLARAQEASLIDAAHLPFDATALPQYKRHGDINANRILVERVLRMTGGNVRKASELLGVSRNTVNAARRTKPPGQASQA